MADTLFAAICGCLVGALVSSAFLIYYAIWRASAIGSFQRNEPTLTTPLLRQFGLPPQENILLVFPAISIGFVLGILVHLWMRRRILNGNPKR